MSKKAFNKITAGLNSAITIARGDADPKTYRVHVSADVDVRKIRKKLKLSQTQFASKFGLPAATVRDWEQNRRRPEGPARVLLKIIEKEPVAASRALSRP